MFASREERLNRALISLVGLSIGDAFGDCFFVARERALAWIDARQLPERPWVYSDDTQMALSLVVNLRHYDGIDQDQLAASFANHYEAGRGYGPNMNGYLRSLRQGEPWRTLVARQFGGQGSYGNGAAMRVAPLGAYFADSLDTLCEHAKLSAEVTHAHPEAIAGAVAVALGAAWAWRLGQAGETIGCSDFIDLLLPAIPKSEVHTKLLRARNFSQRTTVEQAAAMLGSGEQISAQDTVPFVLWCAGTCMSNYEEAMWQTVQGLGDRDTTCAMVGGIIVLYGGSIERISEIWRRAREPLPGWFFAENS
jgi:ADP-ribosylglycohydrolase